jgi:hypothetical protein
VTKGTSRTKPDDLEAVREINRRAGHEIRNALNGVAVNVEVVRSRANRGDAMADVVPFAERAALQVGVASWLTEGMLALYGCLLAAQAEGTLISKNARGQSRIELEIRGDRADGLVFDIKRLADLIGVGIERADERVILTVSPGGKSYSKK